MTVEQPLRLVICDDSDDIAELLSLVMEGRGHAVTLVKTGRDAIEAVLRLKPDVALLDIGLPDVNGYEVARAIRRGLGSQPRLIAITGFGRARDQVRAREAGFDAHVVKPATLATITQAMYRPSWNA